MKVIALPCPSCYRRIDTFQLAANPSDTLTLRATCHPCRTIFELTVTLDDMRDLADGKDVSLQSKNEPAFVM